MASSDQGELKALYEATATLEIQSEIKSVLDTIISDIELKHELETTLNHQREIQVLKGRCQIAEQALEEYKALDQETSDAAKGLVNDLMEDLGGLSCFIKELEIKQPQTTTNVDNDTNMQPVQDLQHSQSESKQQSSTEQHDGTSQADSHSDLKEFEESDAAIKDGDPVSSTKMEEESKVDSSQSKPTNNSQEQTHPAMKSVAITDIITNTSEEKPAAKPTTKKVKKKIKKIVKRRLPPTLQSLSSANLMKIFEYMEAMDIVNMAQTSVLMYSKVDNIFGLGGAGFDTDGRDENVEYEEYTVEEEVEVEIEVEVEVEQENSDAILLDSKESLHKESLSRPTSDQSFSSATIVSIPSSAQLKHDSITNDVNIVTPKIHNLTKPNVAGATAGKVEAKKNTATASTSSVATVSSTAKTSESSSDGGFQLSPAVASALADKLSPMELAAIITMRERLRTKEQEMIQIRNELTTVNAKYDGTISVNDILKMKVKEQKLALDQNKEISVNMNRKSSSDQEVIAFLDERVQHLERGVDNFDNERSKLQSKMDKVQKASEKQLSVLGDMLTFEREQMADNEKEWKSTKKLLVKEVKHCRAKILAVEAERDGLFEENEKLKEALLSIGVTKSNKSFDKSFDYS